MQLNLKDFENKLITNEQKNYFINNIDNISIHKGNFNKLQCYKKMTNLEIFNATDKPIKFFKYRL